MGSLKRYQLNLVRPDRCRHTRDSGDIHLSASQKWRQLRLNQGLMSQVKRSPRRTRTCSAGYGMESK